MTSDGEKLIFIRTGNYDGKPYYIALREVALIPSGVATCRPSSVNVLTEDGLHAAKSPITPCRFQTIRIKDVESFFIILLIFYNIFIAIAAQASASASA